MARKASKTDEGRKTKEKGNGQGTVWQEGEVWRWQITLGYKPDGKQDCLGTRREQERGPGRHDASPRR